MMLRQRCKAWLFRFPASLHTGSINWVFCSFQELHMIRS